MHKKANQAVDKKNAILRLEQQLCFPLYAASRLFTRLYQPLLEPLGLTYPQYIVLMVLWADSPCSVSHIGERTLLNSNTLTPMLKRMEELGYIRRTRTSKDERVVEISLTDDGKRLETRCECIPASLAKHLNYNSEEAGALKRSLNDLIGQLRNLTEPDTLDA
jgi:MarR family transcriptional regulator, organic hydroperoxide resistance regulator